MAEALLAKTRKYLPGDKVRLVIRAFEYARKAHEGQWRKSGEPFIEHPVQVATILADLKMDADAIAAALLHDAVEDCEHVSIEDIRRRFNGGVARLVDGVTKFTAVEIAISESANEVRDLHRSQAHARTIHKMLVAIGEDVRVALLKLADRLHNMLTIDHLPPAKRLEKARETLDIYAPLAHRFGVWGIKWRLEDLAFRQTNPDEYRAIAKRLDSKRAEREEYVEKIKNTLQADMDRARISAEVMGRPKSIYSIHKKTRKYAERDKTVDDIHDLFALRALVETRRDCYAALGVIHERWHPAPGEMDDYIANPKDNMYQSFHTTVIAENGAPMEIQIRTREMDQLAEYGVAAHWLYHDGIDGDDPFENKNIWFRQIMEWSRGITDPEEFVESFKTDIFADYIFVYTPQGDLKELPAGSTPLDFAYRVHSDLVFRCVGAEVNGRPVPLDRRLRNGDVCRIIMSIKAMSPSLDWLVEERGFIRTGAARARVRRWFNRRERYSNVELGRRIYDNYIRNLISIEDERVARLMGMPKIQWLYRSIGSGKMTVSDVVGGLDARAKDEEGARRRRETGMPAAESATAEITGGGDLPVSIAGCCAPAGGDAILGFRTRARGVAVHRADCPNILDRKDDKDRLVPVHWGEAKVTQPVRIQVRARDREKLLGEVSGIAGSENVNITSSVTEEHDGISVITMTLHVSGMKQLSDLFFKIYAVSGVISISRTDRLY